MESSGTRPINKRTTMLAARSLLALFVAYGSIFEMTRETAFTTLTRLDPGVPSAVSPGITYTLVRLKTALRGWPITFYVKTGLPERLSPWAGGIHPAALLCDLIVLGVLIVAAWSLLGTWRLQFYLADLFAVTTSVALMMSFHLVAWHRSFEPWRHQYFELSRIAVDVGAFCAAFTIIRAVRKLAARLARWRTRQPGGQ